MFLYCGYQTTFTNTNFSSCIWRTIKHFCSQASNFPGWFLSVLPRAYQPLALNTDPVDWLFQFQFSVSAQDGIVALGKAHTRSTPSLSSLPKVALETVPIFVWLNTDRSRPWRVECRPLPFSTPLSFRRSMLWCSGLSVLRKFLKPLSTSALPSCRPDVISAVLASLSARSFPLTPACPGQ